jgi:hypothetical protein
MGTNTDISIERGRTGTIVLSVVDLPDSEELIAKLYAVGVMGNAPQIVLEGVIKIDLGTITFDYKMADTKNITIRSLYYEVVVYLADKSFVKNVTSGLMYIIDTVKIDPTT